MPKPPENNLLALQILSAFVERPELFVRFLDQLKPALFAPYPFADIYNAMHYLHHNIGVFDVELLRNRISELKQPEQLNWLDEMIAESVDFSAIYKNVDELRNTHTRTLFYNLGEHLLNASFNSAYTTKGLHKLVTKELNAIDENMVECDILSIKSMLEHTLAQSTLVKQDQLTWFEDNLQQLLSGIYPGELIIVGARPGIGKTAFVHTQLIHTSMHQKQAVGYINFAESKRNLVAKLLRAADNQVYENNMDCLKAWEQKSIPIYLGANLPTNDIDQVALTIKMLVSKYSVKLVVIDCFQDITYRIKYNYRDYELGKVLHQLKQLANELQIAIIITSQLSRVAEKRGSTGRPMLSDLKDTGHLEEVADKVLLLYRDDYYGITMDENGYDTAGVTEVIVAKNREGKTGSVMLSFDGKALKFATKKPDLDCIIFPANRLLELL